MGVSWQSLVGMVAVLFLASTASAQTGSLRGRVVDA